MNWNIDNTNIDIEDFKSQILIIGNYFQCLEEKKGLVLISEFTNNLYSFYSGLIHIKNSSLGDKIFISLNSYFNSIIEGIKNEDYIGLGDPFTYELLPTVSKVQSMFNESI